MIRSDDSICKDYMIGDVQMKPSRDEASRHFLMDPTNRAEVMNMQLDCAWSATSASSLVHRWMGNGGRTQDGEGFGEVQRGDSEANGPSGF